MHLNKIHNLLLGKKMIALAERENDEITLEVGLLLNLCAFAGAQKGLNLNVDGALVVQALHPSRGPKAVGGTPRSYQRSQGSAAMTIFTANIHVGNKRLFRIVVILKDRIKKDRASAQTIKRWIHTLWARKRRTGRECSM
jgi:hypothetical protein